MDWRRRSSNYLNTGSPKSELVHAWSTICSHYCMSASNCTASGLIQSHTDRTIDKSDHRVYRLSYFYPYTILKPQEINCDRDTFGWRTRWADFLWKTSSELAAAIFIRQRALSNRQSGHQLIVFYRRWAIMVTYRTDYRQEWSSKWPCQYTVFQNSTRTLN